MFGFQFFIGAVDEQVTTASFATISPIEASNQPAHRVYTRDNWQDEWVLHENLYCNWAEWDCSPNIPTAEIEWRYGRRLNNTTNEHETVYPKSDSYKPYVKIVIEDIEGGSARMTWYGKVGSITYQDGGYRNVNNTYVRTGKQNIGCVGLEKTLLDTPISFSYVWDDDSETAIKVHRGLTFNAPLESWKPGGNRSVDEHDGSHLFSNQVREDTAFWGVAEIVKYLLTQCNPSYSSVVRTNPLGWFISSDSLVLLGSGTWRPVVETEGRTVKDVLDQLISRRRLLTYYVRVVDNQCELVIVSLAHTTIVGPGSEELAKPNTSPINLLNFGSEYGESVIYINRHEPVDVVRCRGAKATVTCTLSNQDGSLVKGWTNSQETAYEAAGSGLAEYSTAGSYDKKRKLNTFVRSKEDYREVYRFFKLPDDWDYTAGNGVGGSIASIFTWLSPWHTQLDGDYPVSYQREHFLSHRIPLKQGWDYTPNAGDNLMITPTKIDNITHDDRPVYVLMRAQSLKFFEVDKIGLIGDISRQDRKENFQWSGSVMVPDRERGIFVTVVGEPQHIIAKTDYTPLPVDKKNRGSWDWKKMTATVAIQLQRCCEGLWPDIPNRVVEGDYVRELVINCGEEYRLDWLHPYTIVGINADGTVRSNSTGGYINNDSRRLVERAKIAYEWYKVPRKSLALKTHKIGDYLPLGSLIRKFGQDIDSAFGPLPWLEVNSVVTNIRIDIPQGTVDSQPGLITQSYKTDYVHQPDFI